MEDVKEEIPKPILIEDLGMMFATEKSKRKRRYGVYKCGFCGNNFRADTNNIKSNHTNSCGCYRRKLNTEGINRKHNLSYTRIYNIWSDIKNRTLNPKNRAYQYYGGRGITICDDWKNDFMSFYNWAMSNDYSGELSIDRIDNNGNYEPNNCRWTTRTIQQRNQRIQKNNTSGFKGVWYRKDKAKYQSYITINKKRVYLGSYLTAVEGAIAYNNYIIENNLEGFPLNEIPDSTNPNQTPSSKP